MSVQHVLLPADPRANYLAHKEEIDQAIRRVLDSGSYILGQEVNGFEQEFARYLGIGHSIGVGSGTEALHLALRVCGIGQGDGVITVSHTAVATVAAIELAGATPVLVDVDAETFVMDLNRLEDTINKYCSSKRTSVRCRPKAIVPVHLYGQPSDMPAILEIARRYQLYVIEDCAQSHGAAIEGRKTGAWGNIGVFSFYPTKNLGALGDGGALVTDNPRLAEQARSLREYGWRERYISHGSGMNTRLDELQAAILHVKLKYLDKENAWRRELARMYNASLSITDLILPREKNGVEHVYHQYVVRSKRRDGLRRFLQEHSVGTLIHYPAPVHLQPAYKDRTIIGRGGLRNSEQVCREILSLPLHPQMTDAHVKQVSELIVRWHKRGG